MKNLSKVVFSSIVGILLSWGVLCQVSFGEEFVDSFGTDEIYLLKGELETLKVHSLTRLSLSDPSIADIVSANDKEILLIGQSVGQTVLFVWDEHGKRAIVIRVFSQNLELVKERMQRLFKSANIIEASLDINEQEGKIIIIGEVPEHKKEAFDQILGQFSSETFILAKKEEIQDLIQIDMQITELKETLSKTLGIEWNSTLNYNETTPSFDGSVGDFFKIGDFSRTTPLLAKVNALVTEGKGRVLSKPRLVVVNGEQASFNVGGQIPIVTSSSTTTVLTTNVTFHEYGVGITITPKIKKEKVDVVMTVNISNPDSSIVTGNGNTAFTTTTANTHLYLDDKQTVVLAGLIKQDRGVTIDRVPFLGKIPIVGIIFRNRKTDPHSDSEVVISLTPTILEKNRNRPPKQLADSDQKKIEMPSRASFRRPISRASEIPKEMTEYIRAVQQKLTHAIEYPNEASEYGWEGTVKVGLLILRDGTLALASVKEPSGYDVFDDDALSTAKRVAPFDSFPADTDLQELNVTIPIVYSHKNN